MLLCISQKRFQHHAFLYLYFVIRFSIAELARTKKRKIKENEFIEEKKKLSGIKPRARFERDKLHSFVIQNLIYLETQLKFANQFGYVFPPSMLQPTSNFHRDATSTILSNCIKKPDSVLRIYS